ncbi:ABC transporter permease [Lysinibacillus sp. Bpr_S20]|uniref:ABC transporter permease n=1 Tax=Lysinibacillus sp. Bpr_S20 TaxID=2933964 RepID=UPI002013AFFF|nr:ABC transporter permease [Lysinibacillus sp. Bpr_S20]MCL1701769.1 ABC transporter permease [Lysinibacillus sp. Bpr_S20]
MKLFLKLLRDIKQSMGQFIAITIVIAVGAFFYAGLVTYSNTLSAYTKNYFQEHHLSDLNVYYSQLFKNDVTRLRKIEGIDKIEGRYTFDATQTFEDDKTVLKIHSIPENNEINTPTIIEGNLPLNKGEILLDSRYAKEHQYRVGDQITVNANDSNVNFTISGLGENVEHAKKNEIQDHKTYGVAYIAEETLPEILNGLYFNELIVDAKEGYDIDKLGKSIKAQSEGLSYLDQVKKERTLNYSKINQTIDNNNLMSKIIPLVLFLIEAIILFLAMSRTIDSQRNQVGIMKALGVKNSNIMLHYMGYPVLASILGSIIGCALAAFVFIPLVTTSCARAYSLPDIKFSLSLFSIVPPIIFSSAFGVLACYFSSRSVLKERAAQAMRPKPPKKMKKLLIERVPSLWGSISYSYKLILRNIFLNKRKAIASSMGVVVSTVLLITAFGTQASLLKVADQIEEVYTYDLKVDYTIGTSLHTVKQPSGIKESYFLSSFPIEIIKDNEKESATLVVTEEENNLIHFFDEKENGLSLENNGLLVPKSYADKYHISKGDTIKVKFTAPELKNTTVDMEVLNISTQYSNPSFYSTPGYLKRFNIDYNPTTILVQANSSADLMNVRHFFEQDRTVDTIADKNDIKKSAQYIVKQNSFVFIMFIISAIILSFGAIYTISSINIYERNRELATLKVLGYQKNKINRLIFLENILLTSFAVIVALPISGYVYKLIVKALSSTHQQIPDKLNSFIILVAVLLAFLLTIVSNLLLRRKVTKINMIESLKSVE